MILPNSYRPKITQQDIARGAISRYFTQYVSSRIVVEIDEVQYNTYKNDPYYTTVRLPWVLVGNLYTTPSVLSVEEQNRRIVEYYSKTLPALPRYVRNFMEYTQPIINTKPAPPVFVAEAIDSSETTTTTTTTTIAPPPPSPPLIITVYDVVTSTFEPLLIYNTATSMDGIIENVEPMNIVVNQPFFYTPA